MLKLGDMNRVHLQNPAVKKWDRKNGTEIIFRPYLGSYEARKIQLGLESVLRWGTCLEMIMFKFWTQLGCKIPLRCDIYNVTVLLFFSTLVCA